MENDYISGDQFDEKSSKKRKIRNNYKVLDNRMQKVSRKE